MIKRDDAIHEILGGLTWKIAQGHFGDIGRSINDLVDAEIAVAQSDYPLLMAIAEAAEELKTFRHHPPTALALGVWKRFDEAISAWRKHKEKA